MKTIGGLEKKLSGRLGPYRREGCWSAGRGEIQTIGKGNRGRERGGSEKKKRLIRDDERRRGGVQEENMWGIRKGTETEFCSKNAKRGKFQQNG